MTKNMWGAKSEINKFLLEIMKYKRHEIKDKNDEKKDEKDDEKKLNDDNHDDLNYPQLMKNRKDLVDMELVKKDASTLLLASISKENMNKDIFFKVFTLRSFEHIKEIANQLELSSISSTSL